MASAAPAPQQNLWGSYQPRAKSFHAPPFKALPNARQRWADMPAQYRPSNEEIHYRRVKKFDTEADLRYNIMSGILGRTRDSPAMFSFFSFYWNLRPNFIRPTPAERAWNGALVRALKRLNTTISPDHPWEPANNRFDELPLIMEPGHCPRHGETECPSILAVGKDFRVIEDAEELLLIALSYICSDDRLPYSVSRDWWHARWSDPQAFASPDLCPDNRKPYSTRPPLPPGGVLEVLHLSRKTQLNAPRDLTYSERQPHTESYGFSNHPRAWFSGGDIAFGGVAIDGSVHPAEQPRRPRAFASAVAGPLVLTERQQG